MNWVTEVKCSFHLTRVDHKIFLLFHHVHGKRVTVHYLTRAGSSPMSDPVKEVLSIVRVAELSDLVQRIYWADFLLLVVIFLSGNSCEQLAKPSIPMSIPSQITVD